MAKKAKTTPIILILISILFIAGCSSFGTQRGKNQPPTTAAFAATGTEGIVMSFIADQPPPILFTGSPLSVLVEVRNRGTFPAPSVNLFLSGFDPAIITGMTNTFPISNIDAKTQFNPEGGYQTANFVSSPIQLPTTMLSYKPNFLVTACYAYETNANPMVCLDPRPQDKLTDKACVVQKAYPTGGGQGAPVAVTNVESEATPTATFFRIHLQNIYPQGVVYGMGALGKCPNQLDYSDLNKVEYSVTLAGGRVADCQPKLEGQQIIRLANNMATIFCKFSELSGAAYQTPLTIKLNYGYKNSISKQVEIQNTQTQ
jgi:hypothetical protein